MGFLGGTPYVFMMIISLLCWFILVDSENTSWAFRVSRQENVHEKKIFFLPDLKLVTQQSPLCFELLWCCSVDVENISGKFIFNGSQRPLWLSSSCCSNHLDRPLLNNVELIMRSRAQLCPLLLSEWGEPWTQSMWNYGANKVSAPASFLLFYLIFRLI